jgi:hypothetical protein
MSASLRSDDSCLSDGESARLAGSLFVVFEGERARDVLLISASALHGSQDDPVLEVGVSNAYRLKQLWDGRSHLVMGARTEE